MADQAAKDAASLPALRATHRHFSLSFLRRRATERATVAWKNDIEERNSGKRTFRLPMARSRPGIRPQLRGVAKGVAARFFQLLSGHATIAPFLEERWGRTDADVCWWCDATGGDRAENTSSRSAGPGRRRSESFGRGWERPLGQGKRRANPSRAGRALGIGSGKQGRGPPQHICQGLTVECSVRRGGSGFLEKHEGWRGQGWCHL